MFRNTFAEINLENFRANLKTLKSLSNENSFFCPMIKSNAYGHGDVELAKIMEQEGVNSIGVALLEEGVRLREAGIQNSDIYIFGPFRGGAEAIKEHGLTPVISEMDQLKELNEKLSGDSYSVHLKFNTGMNRLGFDGSDIEKIQQLLEGRPRLNVTGICSHLAAADDFMTEEGYTSYQLKKFINFVEKFTGKPLQLHIFNSAGHIAKSIARKHEDLGSRPGISLYGVKPTIQQLSSQQQAKWDSIVLEPVMTLKSEIITYHRLEKGDRVSYGGTWVAPRKSVIAVVPIGYADGYQRLFSNRGRLLFRGERVPVVGRVCMDYILADLTGVLGSDVGAMGEEVVLFGRQGNVHLPVTELAEIAETISYELLAGIGRRVPRKFV